jgi:hypothetical protein
MIAEFKYFPRQKKQTGAIAGGILTFYYPFQAPVRHNAPAA